MSQLTKTFKIDGLMVHKFLVAIITVNVWLTDMPLISELYVEIKSIVLGIVVIGILFEIFLSKYRLSFLILTVILLCLSIFLYYNTNNLWSFYLIYFICFSRNIGLKDYLLLTKKILLFIFTISIITFFVQFVLFPDSLYVVTTRGMVRYCLNFESPNSAARALVCLMLLNFMCSKQKFTANKLMLFLALVFVFYYFTNSATVFLCFLIVLFDYFRENKSVEKLVEKITRWSLPFATLFSFLSVYFYPHYYINVIDKVMTGRIALSKESFKYYGITLFGQSVDIPRWALTSDGTYQLLTCDNTYIYSLISLGLVLIPLLIVFNFIFVKKLDYRINVGVIIFSVFTLIYYDSFSPICFFPLVAVAVAKFEEKQKIVRQV